MDTFVEQLSNNFLLNTLYDIFKFFISYFLARGIYDGVYKKMRWGGWITRVNIGKKVLAERKIAPNRAETILNDDNDLSIYLKGVVSPHGWLNIDICSEQAKNSGLLVVDKLNKHIIVDLQKNPDKK